MKTSETLSESGWISFGYWYLQVEPVPCFPLSATRGETTRCRSRSPSSPGLCAARAGCRGRRGEGADRGKRGKISQLRRGGPRSTSRNSREVPGHLHPENHKKIWYARPLRPLGITPRRAREQERERGSKTVARGSESSSPLRALSPDAGGSRGECTTSRRWQAERPCQTFSALALITLWGGAFCFDVRARLTSRRSYHRFFASTLDSRC